MPRKRIEETTYRLVTRKGRRKWYIDYTEPGKRNQRISTTVEIKDQGFHEGTNDSPEPCEDALTFLAEFIAARDKPEKPTVAELMDRRLRYWQNLRQRSKRRQAAAEGQHKPIKDYFGSWQPERVTKTTVARYIKWRTDNSGKKDGSAPIAAIRRELEELRAAFYLAVEDDILSDVPKIDLPDPRPPREQFLTEDQGRHLLTIARTSEKAALHVKLFVIIASVSGRRAGAILDLDERGVNEPGLILDFDNPDVQETKKRRGKCPVPQWVMDEIKLSLTTTTMKRPRKVINYNGKPVGDIKKAFKRLAEEAGLPWLTPHLLKHSVISWLAQRDWSVDRISDFTDTDPKTVRRIYRKVNPSYLRDVSDEMADILGESRVNTPSGRKNKSAKSG